MVNSSYLLLINKPKEILDIKKFVQLSKVETKDKDDKTKTNKYAIPFKKGTY